MTDRTKIEWTDATWNPVTGCTKVSPGCDHCYAETIAHRFAGTTAYPNGFRVTLRPERLDQPLRWRGSKRVFVNSMSDLFHDDIPDEYIARIWAVMAWAPQHTFQILTKRSGRMRSLLNSAAFLDLCDREWCNIVDWCTARLPDPDYADIPNPKYDGPLPNVWLGVSAEDQRWADVRIPVLLDTPAAVRFVSVEPLLGPIDFHGPLVDGWHRPRLTYWLTGRPHFDTPDRSLAIDPRLDWVIVGGESGHGARPMHPRWVRTIRDQCIETGTAFHFKQWGEWAPAHWNGEDGATHAFTGGAYVERGHLVEHFMELDNKPTSLERDLETPPGAQGMRRDGKRVAGRDLDGRTWHEFPGGAA